MGLALAVLMVLAASLSLALLSPSLSANGWEHWAIPLEALIKGLEADDTATRQRSAEFLGRRRETEAVQPLLDLVGAREQDRSVRSAAYLALGQIGDRRALPSLETCMRSESDQVVRSDCVTALGNLANTGTLPGVLHALHHDESILVRTRAVDALGNFSDPTAVAELITLLEQNNRADIRVRAIRALGRGRGEGAVAPLIDALARSEDDAERIAIVRSFAHLRRPKAIPALKALLESTDTPVLRVGAVAALATIGESGAYTTLVEMLHDEVPAVRYYAVEGLRSLGDARAAAALVKLSLALSARTATRSGVELVGIVNTATIDLRLETTALRALTDLDPVTGLPALLAAVRPIEVERSSVAALEIAGAVHERRRVALYGLGYTGSKQAADVLAGHYGLRDEDARLRATAARSIAVLDFDDAPDILIDHLDDKSPEVRMTIAGVLGALGKRRAVRPLIALLEDTSSDVRREAARSLGYLGDDKARVPLRDLLTLETTESVRGIVKHSLELLNEQEQAG